jgi:hypothetical protein
MVVQLTEVIDGCDQLCEFNRGELCGRIAASPG